MIGCSAIVGIGIDGLRKSGAPIRCPPRRIGKYAGEAPHHKAKKAPARYDLGVAGGPRLGGSLGHIFVVVVNRLMLPMNTL